MTLVAKPEFVVAAGGSHSDVTGLGDGGFLDVWTAGGNVFAQRYAASGEVTVPAFRVDATTNGSQSSASTTSLSDGGFVISWQDQDEIVFQRYDAAGAVQGAKVSVTSSVYDADAGLFLSTVSGPAVAELNNGDIVVAWNYASYLSPPIGDYRAQRYDALGAPQGSELVLVHTGDPMPSPAQITATADGGFVSSWSPYPYDGPEGFAQQYDSSGTGTGIIELPVGRSDSGFSSSDFSVTAQTGGGFAVLSTFYYYRSGGVVSLSRYAESGELQSVSSFVLGDIDRPARSPTLAALDDGSFVACWVQGDSVSAQRFDAAGDLLGGILSVDTGIYGATGSYGEPSVAPLEGGGFFVSWTSAEDGSSGIQGRTFVASNDGTPGDDGMHGTAEGDIANGLDGNDTIFTYDGDDTIDGGVGDDTIDGGTGNDTIAGGDGIDTIDAGDGADTVYGGAGNDIIKGGLGNDKIVGGDGNDNIDGSEGADHLEGGAGDDTLNGSNQTADAVTAIDTLIGGLGDDTYFVDDSNDLVVENPGEGNDRIFSLATYSLSGRHVETLTLTGTANIDAIGNSLAQTLNGNVGNNGLYGGGGNDTLNGGYGNDIVDGGTGADTMSGGFNDDIYYVDDAGDVVFEYDGQGTDTVISAINYNLSGKYVEVLTLTGGANLNGYGNSLVQTINGNGGNNALFGLAGRDVLNGNAGNDVLDGGTDVDVMAGGLGDDTFYVDDASDDVQEIAGQGSDTVFSSVSYNLSGRHVEALTLTGSANIDAIGNSLAQTLEGNAGANSLYGAGGDDVLNGAAGADKLYGGLGDDVFYVDNAGDQVFENQDEGFETVYSTVTYNLSGRHIEILALTGNANIDAYGNSLDQTLAGNAANNTLVGLGGHDVLIGYAGNDVLDGGIGADTMTGGADNDTYYVDNTGDVVNEALGQGSDTIYSSVSYNLSGRHVETLVLTGSADIDAVGNSLAQTLSGNSGRNAIYAGGGDDVLNGFGGNDSLYGGAGRDVFSFSSAAGAANADIILDFAPGDDFIFLSRSVFLGLNGGSQLSPLAFRSGTAALDADDRIIYNSATGALSYDPDGAGGLSALLFATLTPGTALTSADFLL